MADETLQRSYTETMNDIVRGTLHTSPMWEQWFRETAPGTSLEDRVREIFEERGMVPTPIQFERAKMVLGPENAEPTVGPSQLGMASDPPVNDQEIDEEDEGEKKPSRAKRG
jgi:hypothetical protein